MTLKEGKDGFEERLGQSEEGSQREVKNITSVASL